MMKKLILIAIGLSLTGFSGCLLGGCMTLKGNGKYIFSATTSLSAGQDTEVATPEQKASSSWDFKPLVNAIIDLKALKAEPEVSDGE